MRYTSFISVLLMTSAPSVLPAKGPASTSILREYFARPPRHFASAPLWVWNDFLTEEEVIATLRDLAGQGVKQAFVHPRPGLMTPYLSSDWFRLWKVAMKEAKSLDMNLWIYDENSYPSGFAGGLVPEAMPESRGCGLVLREVKKPSRLDTRLVAVFRKTQAREEYERIPIEPPIESGQDWPEGEYLVASLSSAGESPWFAGKFYVDLLRPGVTEKFLDITLEPYRKQMGRQFGKRLPGVFTDEPHLKVAPGLPWTPDLPQAFEARWGYSLLDELPCLAYETGDWKRVRHNFLQVLLDLFIERWAQPYTEYCERNCLEFTGHYWEHEWPNLLSGPDSMAMYAWHHRPAIDILFNQYAEDTHAQFGNIRSVVELASVAHQMGCSRTLCETYGGSGWDCRFEDMKRIGDWTYVLGVNTLDEHLSHVTLRGARKRDYPPTFSYHEPWWEAYHVMEEYFTRLSLVLSFGDRMASVLLLEPTTTAWMYQNSTRESLGAIGSGFQDLVTALAKAQVEFDIGSEDIMGRHGSVHGGSLQVGQVRYDAVVLPPLTENLNARTVDLLNEYLKEGGLLLALATPGMVDGRSSSRMEAWSSSPGWKTVEAQDLPKILLERQDEDFSIRQDKVGLLLHQRRRFSEGEFLFLTNTSADKVCSGTVVSRARSVERWDAQKGLIEPYPCSALGGRIEVFYELAQVGSLLLFLSDEAAEPVPDRTEPCRRIESTSPVCVDRLESNVLTLDYLDVKAGGELLTNAHVSEASAFGFRKNGMGFNPWNHTIQFRDEWITKSFPKDSGLEATYRFRVEDQVPSPLFIVIERPDLYRVSCNGIPVTWDKNSWWLDRAFGKIEMSSQCRIGENAITLVASPFTVFHELEAVYVLGEFSLKPEEQGFSIVSAQDLQLGPWNEQGAPLYGHRVRYSQEFNGLTAGQRVKVSLPSWLGSVARVDVNGKEAGVIAYPPWQCDVSDQIASGSNRIEVTVYGTLKNTLGPHHGNPGLGFASPGSFGKAKEPGVPPGNQYHTVGYGLFSPFEVWSE